MISSLPIYSYSTQKEKRIIFKILFFNFFPTSHKPMLSPGDYKKYKISTLFLKKIFGILIKFLVWSI